MKKQSKYLEYIEDHIIFDCIVAKKFVGLLTREPKSKSINIKLVTVNFDGAFSGYYNLKHFFDAKGCVVRDPENPGVILTSSNAQVYFHGFVGDDSVDDFEDDITLDDGVQISNVKFIDGNAYAVSTLRDVYKRVNISKWENISKGSIEEGEISDTLFQVNNDFFFTYKQGGFLSIDGFSSHDIYAAGFDGYCWHFNGTKWKKIHLPISTNIKTVCCAEDGQVYLGGDMETVVKGRNNTWEIIHQGTANQKIKKIVSFKGKIYMSTTLGLYVLNDEKYEKVSHIKDFAYLDTNENKTHLVTGGDTVVHIFDGIQWRELIK